MRQKIIAGNWKMYKTNLEAIRLATQLKNRLEKKPPKKSKVVVCPPFTALSVVSQTLKGSKIQVGAQNMYIAEEGPYTGEISGKMIKSSGARWVIIGHSERRQYFKEDEKFLNLKILAALNSGLKIIFCVGERLEERQQKLTMDIVGNQVEWGLKGLPTRQLANIVIAYEPVWAIGTGKTATPEQAQQVHDTIRDVLDALWNAEAAKKMTILYGGSVKPENAEALLSQPDIDGALVGGACLKVDSFHKIILAGEKAF